MPKTYPNSRKEKWLNELSQGKTIKQIAAKHKVDMRTVKQGIEDVQGRHAAQETKAQIFRDALRGHYDRLNSALGMIIDELRLPEPYFTEMAWSEILVHQEILEDTRNPPRSSEQRKHARRCFLRSGITNRAFEEREGMACFDGLAKIAEKTSCCVR